MSKKALKYGLSFIFQSLRGILVPDFLWNMSRTEWNMSRTDGTCPAQKKAKIANNVTVGAFSVIGPNVEIGESTKIHSHVNLTGNTKIGKKMKYSLLLL